MKKLVFIIVLLQCAGSESYAHAEDVATADCDAVAIDGDGTEPAVDELARLWEIVKGAPPDDSIVLGMRSFHTNDEHYNDNNHMVALDYNGYTAGTFNNSFRQQVFFAGVCREIYRRRITANTTLDIRYRAGVMHGYRSHYPNIRGFSAVALPFTSLCYKRTGVDILVTPSSRPVIAVSLRFKL